MSQLSIRLFSSLKDRAGQSRINIPLDAPTTVSELLQMVAAIYPALAPSLAISSVAVNRAYADPDTVVSPTDEVALFPPVSGG